MEIVSLIEPAVWLVALVVMVIPPLLFWWRNRRQDGPLIAPQDLLSGGMLQSMHQGTTAGFHSIY